MIHSNTIQSKKIAPVPFWQWGHAPKFRELKTRGAFGTPKLPRKKAGDFSTRVLRRMGAENLNFNCNNLAVQSAVEIVKDRRGLKYGRLTNGQIVRC